MSGSRFPVSIIRYSFFTIKINFGGKNFNLYIFTIKKRIDGKNTTDKLKLMIARTWHGVVPIEKADAYYSYLMKTGMKDYRSIPGNVGVTVLRRDENQQTHFLLITSWDSYESIKQFAGEEYEKAWYYPEDEKYLVKLEPFVHHYEILEDH